MIGDIHEQKLEQECEAKRENAVLTIPSIYHVWYPEAYVDGVPLGTQQTEGKLSEGGGESALQPVVLQIKELKGNLNSIRRALQPPRNYALQTHGTSAESGNFREGV